MTDHDLWQHLEAEFARAVAEHNVAARDAEIEALREVLAKIDGIAELALRFNAAREGRE